VSADGEGEGFEILASLFLLPSIALAFVASTFMFVG
jgi:hypothetical protein